MVAPITFNGNRVIDSRFFFARRGSWVADLTLDLDDVSTFTFSGEGSVVVGSNTLVGSIDANFSGSFGPSAQVRLVGGIGWNQVIKPQYFHDPSGKTFSTAVYGAVAAQVGEPTPVDANPIISTSWRVGGAAANVFADRQWYVDPTTGMVQVAEWPTATPDSSFVLINFDAALGLVEGMCDEIVLPGMTISDPRLQESLTVYDVEQSFGEHGSRVIGWVGDATQNRFLDLLTNFVRGAADTQHLKFYQYRFVLNSTPGSSDLALQAISPNAPDLNPVTQWEGLSGAVTNFAPGAVVVIGFTADVPSQPFLASVSPSTVPLSQMLAVQQTLLLGDGNGAPLAYGAWADALAQALVAFASGCSGSTDPTLVTTAGKLATALQSLPTSKTTKTGAS